MSSPCHIELVLTEKGSDVKNEAVSDAVRCRTACHGHVFGKSARLLCCMLLWACMTEPDTHASLLGMTGPQGAKAQQGAAGQEVEERKQVKEHISFSICVNQLVTTGSFLYLMLLACRACMFC